MALLAYLEAAAKQGGSDLFLIPGSGVTVKIRGELVPLSEKSLSPETADGLIREMYEMAGREIRLLFENGDDDFSFAVPGLCRFRCNAYRQRGSSAATCRIVHFDLPDPEKLHIPSLVMDLAEQRSGLVLVTGPAGSGKSTTLACLIDRINSTRSGHIVTIEDPIEYLHRHKKSLVSQREVPGDAASFPRALRAALRQAPDVVMVGEMRDTETIRTAITAAETGHLVLSSLHTVGAAKTVDRMIDSFPASQQAQIRQQLALVLKSVVSQRLLPASSGERIPVFEVMNVNPAIQNLIRDGRTHQMDNVIYGAHGQSMLSLDQELTRLFREGRISRETALSHAAAPELLEKRL